MFNIAYKFTGKHDEAEDLTQDIFLKIFKSLHTFDRRANFQTWLVSVSRNLCIDHYRSVRKERETIDRDVDAGELTPAAPTTSADRRRSSSATASSCCARPWRSCRRRCARRCMLRDIQELSYQEIADRLDLPEGTVKSRINRGRTELARQIQRLRRRDSKGVRRMNLTTDRTHDVAIVRVGETRMMYPLLPTSPARSRRCWPAATRKVLIDLSKVTYVDSATIGCLMDLYRQTTRPAAS